MFGVCVLYYSKYKIKIYINKNYKDINLIDTNTGNPP
jgi:hypothetical protein